MKKPYVTPLTTVRHTQVIWSLMQSFINPAGQTEELTEEEFNW